MYCGGRTGKGLFNKIAVFTRCYWKIISIFLMVVLFVIAILCYWLYRSQSQATHSSADFDRLISAINSSTPNNIRQLIEFSNKDNSHYSVFAALKVAQFYVMEQKDYPAAITLLENTLTKTKNEMLRDIILIRIARLQYQLGLTSQSLVALDKVKNSGWAAIVNTIRGDVWRTEQNYDKSIVAYKTALSSNPAPDLKNSVEMKLNQVLYLKKR